MKCVVLLCLVGVAVCFPQGGPQQYEYVEQQQPRRLRVEEEEYDPPEPYQFSLAVADDEFTNYQSRSESQDENGLVEGQFSFVAPDGIRYTTTYTADPVNGFQAQTHKEATDIKIRFPEPFPLDEQAGFRQRSPSPQYEQYEQ